MPPKSRTSMSTPSSGTSKPPPGLKLLGVVGKQTRDRRRHIIPGRCYHGGGTSNPTDSSL